MASRLARVFAFAVVCLAMFEVPSSILVTRGYSPWLALGAGLAAFPVVPLAWHVLAERKRGAGGSGWSRLAYRTLAVAAIAFAIVVMTARGSIRDAMRNHLLWFLPDRTVWFTGDPPPLGSRPMCEAFATMENKCAEFPANYAAQVELCMRTPEFQRHMTISFTPNIEVAERCAIRTTTCTDYQACIAAGKHDR